MSSSTPCDICIMSTSTSQILFTFSDNDVDLSDNDVGLSDLYVDLLDIMSTFQIMMLACQIMMLSCQIMMLACQILCRLLNYFFFYLDKITFLRFIS